MSRAYRISVNESLARHLQVDDGLCSTLELLPVLEKERMAELLGAELERRGFTREGNVAKRSQGEGVVVEISLDSGEVKVTAEGHQDLSLETTRAGASVSPDDASVRARLQAAAQAQLESDAKAEEQRLRQHVTRQLEGALQGLKGELDEAVTKVTQAALKQRASELGTVESVQENPHDGSLVIKVRV